MIQRVRLSFIGRQPPSGAAGARGTPSRGAATNQAPSWSGRWHSTRLATAAVFGLAALLSALAVCPEHGAHRLQAWAEEVPASAIQSAWVVDGPGFRGSITR
ncbi:MAG: hypothetical protein AAF675_12060 [Pseudomonadota bacterium]